MKSLQGDSSSSPLLPNNSQTDDSQGRNERAIAMHHDDDLEENGDDGHDDEEEEDDDDSDSFEELRADDDYVFLEGSRPKSQDVEIMESVFKDIITPLLIRKRMRLFSHSSVLAILWCFSHNF